MGADVAVLEWRPDPVDSVARTMAERWAPCPDCSHPLGRHGFAEGCVAFTGPAAGRLPCGCVRPVTLRTKDVLRARRDS